MNEMDRLILELGLSYDFERILCMCGAVKRQYQDDPCAAGEAVPCDQ